MTVHLRRLIPGALALASALAIGVTGMAQATTSHHHHHHRHHHHHARHIAIPQHNGGDRDADNNGGPSDGDGDI